MYRRILWITLIGLAATAVLAACGSEGTDHGWEYTFVPSADTSEEEPDVPAPKDTEPVDARPDAPPEKDIQDDGTADVPMPDVEPDVPQADVGPDVYVPPTEWTLLEGFTRGEVIFRLGERLMVRTYPPDVLEVNYTEPGAGWASIGNLSYGGIVENAKSAEFAAPGTERYLLATAKNSTSPRLYKANSPNGTYREINFSKFQQTVRELESIGNRLFVRTDKALYRRSSPSDPWVETAPLRLERGVEQIAVRAGRLYIVKPRPFANLERWAVSEDRGNSWTTFMPGPAGAPKDPELWAVVNQRVYAIQRRKFGNSFQGTFTLIETAPGGNIQRIDIQSNWDVPPGNLAGLQGELYGVGDGYLLRIKPDAGTVTRILDRPIGDVTELRRIGDRLIANTTTGIPVEWERGANRWRMLKAESGPAQSVTVRDGEVFAKAGFLAQYDIRNRVWRIANTSKSDEPLRAVFKAGPSMMARPNNSCLFRLNASGSWTPLLRWTNSGVEFGTCPTDAEPGTAVDVAHSNGEYFVGYDGSFTFNTPQDGQDRLYKWSAGSRTLSELSTSSEWDTFRALRYVGATNNRIWVSTCPLNFQSTCYQSKGSTTLKKSNFGSSVNGPFGWYRGSVFAVGGSNNYVYEWESGTNKVSWVRTQFSEEVVAKAVTNTQGAMVATTANIRRYDPVTNKWEIIVDSLPIKEATVEHISAGQNRLAVSLNSGGVWTVFPDDL